MNDSDFMLLAIKQAKKSSEKLKCGVVITEGQKIITRTFNKQHSLNDATAHAEIIAISKAGKKLGNKNLSNCTIYCTCEPCSMCLSAIVFSKIKRLVYGVSLKDVSENNKRIRIETKMFLEKCPNKPEVTKNFMYKECKQFLYN